MKRIIITAVCACVVFACTVFAVSAESESVQYMENNEINAESTTAVSTSEEESAAETQNESAVLESNAFDNSDTADGNFSAAAPNFGGRPDGSRGGMGGRMPADDNNTVNVPDMPQSTDGESAFPQRPGGNGMGGRMPADDNNTVNVPDMPQSTDGESSFPQRPGGNGMGGNRGGMGGMPGNFTGQTVNGAMQSGTAVNGITSENFDGTVGLMQTIRDNATPITAMLLLILGFVFVIFYKRKTF